MDITFTFDLAWLFACTIGVAIGLVVYRTIWYTKLTSLCSNCRYGSAETEKPLNITQIASLLQENREQIVKQLKLTEPQQERLDQALTWVRLLGEMPFWGEIWKAARRFLR